MGEKFRPRQISDVVGQDTVKNLIRRSLRNKSFPKFSLMYGPSGTGKSTMAEICGLALTCENPDNGEPCCKCKSCIGNLQQLDSGQKSMNLVKINMGAIERTDFKQTIKEVFTLQPMLGDNAVYIFEEIQALSKDDQNILLEYISNIKNNIYVIACTTEINRLRQELRNRAIKFQFKQLSNDEAITLLGGVCASKGISMPPKDLASFLMKSVSNCPREIVNMIDFLSDSDSMNEITLREFLGYVPNELYIQYLANCKNNTYEFVQWLDTVSDSGYQNFIKGVRNFLIDCYGYIYGSNKQYFNIQEKHKLKDLFANSDEDKLLDLMEYFDSCKYDDETSARYCLIAGRRKFNGKDLTAVVKESNREASMSVIQSEKKARNIERKKVNSATVNEADLDMLLKGFQRIEQV